MRDFKQQWATSSCAEYQDGGQEPEVVITQQVLVLKCHTKSKNRVDTKTSTFDVV